MKGKPMPVNLKNEGIFIEGAYYEDLVKAKDALKEAQQKGKPITAEIVREYSSITQNTHKEVFNELYRMAKALPYAEYDKKESERLKKEVADFLSILDKKGLLDTFIKSWQVENFYKDILSKKTKEEILVKRKNVLETLFLKKIIPEYKKYFKPHPDTYCELGKLKGLLMSYQKRAAFGVTMPSNIVIDKDFILMESPYGVLAAALHEYIHARDDQSEDPLYKKAYDNYDANTSANYYANPNERHGYAVENEGIK